MTPSVLLWILAGIALIAFVSYRQTQFSPVNPAKAAKLPVALLISAVVMAASQGAALTSLRPGAADLLLLAAEALVAVAAGWGMGRLAQIAPVDGVLSSRLRPAGLAVWFGFILIRVAGGVIADVDHLALAASLPLVFVMLAIVKGTQAAVVSGRVARHERGAAADGQREQARA